MARAMRGSAGWVAAGIITPEQAEAIRAHEAAHKRPLLSWTLVGLGALLVGLGLVSLIAANWQAVPGAVRLAVHAALLLAAAAWVWRETRAEVAADADAATPVREADGDAGDRAGTEHPLLGDAARFILAALALTFFGHVGQIYQTTAPLWQPVAVWLALMTPLFLLYGRRWLVAAAWIGGLAVMLGALASDLAAMFRATPTTAFGVMAAVPALVAAGALVDRWRRQQRGERRADRPEFWRALAYLALVWVMLGAVGFHIAARFDGDGTSGEAFRVALTALPIMLGAAGLIAWQRRDAAGRASAGVIAAAGVTSLLAAAGPSGALWGALMTLSLFGVLGWAALTAGWRQMFTLAVTAAALRLIVLSFELSNDLLFSGVGMIVTGLLAIGIAWGAVRVRQRFAPPAKGAAR